jgi:hypothetical protein
MATPTSGRWWLVLSGYAIGGLALGLADAALGRGVGQFGLRPGLATAAIVNLLLPALAVGLALARPRLAMAWLGALVMTAAFTLGLAGAHPREGGWEIGPLLRAIPPVLVMAGLGYAVVGSLAVLIARGARA